MITSLKKQEVMEGSTVNNSIDINPMELIDSEQWECKTSIKLRSKEKRH